ncbi:ABC transporter ATP-binding protein [Sulfuriroseicoccus oceanibius]|uniref:ABC transporter ATP-binding protein n=1 Tax=Sulfuriroseicoccus oceanibius TaxID=2707525 RepID=A0A6B3L9L0_9BACT|nr:ABC transporter ATP-binding protein [Sulfuriroseicoccus oceanibius]QQL45112.1 ABC transporter ATP-binding protein [Sulfuriroseicoccus oceanibius]
MSTTKNAIVAENLVRSFGPVRAVNNVSFEVPVGSVVGFIGANGAGKTTTMRMLATLDQPDSGRALINGYDAAVYPDRIRDALGWMPDSYGAYDGVTIVEYLDFYARALGFTKADRVARVKDVMDFTGLTPLAERMTNKLSKGQGQRLCLGRALIHDPAVMIMDEPAAGLDPQARVELKRLIRLLADEGKTIFISSHILAELSEMCDSMLFINNGEIIHHGSAESLLHGAGAAITYRVQIADTVDRIAAWCETSPGVTLVEEIKGGVRLALDHNEPSDAAAVLRRMVQDGLPVSEFHREARKLEDAFIEMLQSPAASPPPVPAAAVTADA